GEVSGPMAREAGAAYTLVGHSERRQYFHEDNALVALKTLSALNAGLTPIVCVGESLGEREAGKTKDVVLTQTEAVFDALNDAQRLNVVLAYEPVWAIGTGKVATPLQAQEVHAALRERLRAYSPVLAEQMRILYGGSMNAANAAELL